MVYPPAAIDTHEPIRIRSISRTQPLYFGGGLYEPIITVPNQAFADSMPFDTMGLRNFTIQVETLSGSGAYSVTLAGAMRADATTTYPLPTPVAIAADGLTAFTTDVPFLFLAVTSNARALKITLYGNH